MKKKEKAKVYETDLYKPIQNYFIQRGYEVYGEVKNCDVTAVKGEEIIIVELKRSFNLGLLMQAVQRQKVSELVYVAVPRPSVSLYSKRWKDISLLLPSSTASISSLPRTSARMCRKRPSW